ncbi:methylated-DNA--[protein]-cysteine S-methyltransferase [Vulgatibacter sp.]|uniref:methylated-DNA--[protein]-cysteine S-methyltransferase n=1 Tax=Vulgatibacter sp. TaxID=1971226 RepID=UPI003568B812
MATHGFTLFETAIGPCGVAWGDGAITGVQLPEGDERATRARLSERFPDATESQPPDFVARTVDGIVALLEGRGGDLAGVALDFARVPPFHRKVYALARAIPPGQTLTYGTLAAQAGSPGSARAVGQAMGRNPFPIIVPCHRVLAANGKPGGFSASGGVTTKKRMLAIEGAAGTQADLPIVQSQLTFDLDEAGRHLRMKDPALARLIDSVGPFRMELKTTSSLFGALAEAIVHQQLSPRAAATIFGRVCGIFRRAQEAPIADQIHRVSAERLREAGLSPAKILALKDLARRARERTLPTLEEAHSLDDDAIVARLTAVRGIGRWTAQMFLIFRLGRPDVLPSDDYALRKGYALAFHKRALPDKAALEKHGTKWEPFRTVASWYLWRAAELPPGA